MNATQQVSSLKSKVERLKEERVRLQERVESLNGEKERLLEEARQLGLDDTRQLSEWVANKQAEFDTALAALKAAVQTAEGVPDARGD